MKTLGLKSPFFGIGFALSVLLTLLAWGFSQAPRVARQTLSNHIADRMALQAGESYFRAVANCDRSRVQRPRLPPRQKLSFPIYPGCEQEADYEDRVHCGIQRFATFIRTNQKEPAGSAKERVIVSFVIDRATGVMRDLQIRRSRDPRNAKEALRVLNLMIDRGVRWVPATKLGEPFDMQLTVPISFHGAGCGQ